MKPKSYRARTILELCAKVYAAHGWNRRVGESRTERVSSLYNVTVDHRTGFFVATRRA